MKDNRLEHKIDFDKLNKVFGNYECNGQLSFMMLNNELQIVEETINIEVKENKVE